MKFIRRTTTTYMIFSLDLDQLICISNRNFPRNLIMSNKFLVYYNCFQFAFREVSRVPNVINAEIISVSDSLPTPNLHYVLQVFLHFILNLNANEILFNNIMSGLRYPKAMILK